MKVAITGAGGFLGWHTSCRLRSRHDVTTLRLGREEMSGHEVLSQNLAGADVVLHLAGVNRPRSGEDPGKANVGIAEVLARAIRVQGRPIRIVYANSIQADLDNDYGRGKADAGAILRDAAHRGNGSFVDVRLPNLFGEHGRPHYNSFVATFADMVSRGEVPEVHGNAEVPLLHAQAAAEVLVAAALGEADAELRPPGDRRRVSDVLDLLRGFHALYRIGDTPDLSDPFIVDLFNTYRSYTFPQQSPRYPEVHSDPRGVLVETARSHGGTGQAFVSTTHPGHTRGDHYHLRKFERFFVVAGQAEINLRRLFDDKVVTFRLDGTRPGYVDMPTMWVHNIRNIGSADLVTVFWADQLLDRHNPDQYPEAVHQEAP